MCESEVSEVQQTTIEKKPEIKKTQTKETPSVYEEIPSEVVDIVLEEVLSLVGEDNWNDPLNVSKTIAKMMSIDMTKPTTEQNAAQVELNRTVLAEYKEDRSIPIWVCQSIIRVDGENGFVKYNGSEFNKLYIILHSDIFREKMEKVCKYAMCKYEVRWKDSEDPETRLYQRTDKNGHSWLSKCAKPLIKEGDTKGIDIKHLVLISFKRLVEV